MTLHVTVLYMEGLGPHRPVTLLAEEADNIADLFMRRVQHSDAYTAYFSKEGQNWQGTSWSQWKIQAFTLAQGLIQLGCTPGDPIAILGPTRPEWAVFEIAVQLAGCISLGIYPKQSAHQIEYILAHSEAKIILVDSQEELSTVIEATQSVTTLEHIVPWPNTEYDKDADPRLLSFSELVSSPADEDLVKARSRRRSGSDIAMFVYTSGTTGPPKCAMLSHGNILSVLSVQDDLLDFYEDDLSLSFLPMAHVAERVLAFYGRICAGIATAYATQMATVLQELGEVRPTVFGSVPRIFEKAFARIESEIAQKSPSAQKVFRWAEAVGRSRIRHILNGESVPFSLRLKFQVADRLVFKKIRAAFGGRVRHFMTGAAPIPLNILEFFWAAGLPIYECYGQTEATVVTHANAPGRIKLGSVGKIASGLEQRIAEDGEVLIKGPFVFQGYYKDPQSTEMTIVDGWLHTGDIGTLDEDGFLTITDRKKHIMITAGGKNLTPANISKAIKSTDSLISHVHAHADRRPYVSAIIALSPVETLEFGVQAELIPSETYDELLVELMANPAGRSTALCTTMALIAQHPDIRHRIQTAVHKGNALLAQVETVKKFIILERDFSQESGELTPTMKLKRAHIETMYAETFDRIYTEDDFAMTPC